MLNKISFQGLGVGHPANPYDNEPSFMTKPKIPTRSELRADPQSDVATLMRDYYPKFKKVPSGLPNAPKYTARFEDFYKSSFVDQKIAEQVFQESQKARRRNTESTQFSTKQPINMNIMVPNSYMSRRRYKKWAPVPPTIDIIAYNPPFDKKRSDPDKTTLDFINTSDTVAALGAAEQGAHYNPNLNKIIVPRTEQYKSKVAPYVLSTLAHEMQHVNAQPYWYDEAGKVRPTVSRTRRKLYSTVAGERTRVYHSMKAMASDLARIPIKDYNKAVEILKNNGILTSDTNNRHIRHKSLKIMPLMVDDKHLVDLIRSGRIQPTDPTMIDDVLDLNDIIDNPDSIKHAYPFLNYFKKHGVHPYTKKPFRDMLKNELDSKGKPLIENPKEYYKRLWEMIRKIEFEEASRQTTHKFGIPQYV